MSIIDFFLNLENSFLVSQVFYFFFSKSMRKLTYFETMQNIGNLKKKREITTLKKQKKNNSTYWLQTPHAVQKHTQKNYSPNCLFYFSALKKPYKNRLIK